MTEASIDYNDRELFRAELNRAIGEGEEAFDWQGKPVLVPFARLVLEYFDSIGPKDG